MLSCFKMLSFFSKHSDVDTLPREDGGERFQTIPLVENAQHHLKFVTVNVSQGSHTHISVYKGGLCISTRLGNNLCALSPSCMGHLGSSSHQCIWGYAWCLHGRENDFSWLALARLFLNVGVWGLRPLGLLVWYCWSTLKAMNLKRQRKNLNLVQSVGNHMYKRCAFWVSLFSNLHCIIHGRQKRWVH